jgi:alkylation response protein AidB-like acyl-CoA dehydrogenase
MAFFQDPPRLKNQFHDDPLLREYLDRILPPDMRRAVEPEFVELGELSGGVLHDMQLRDRLNEPRLTPWDAWGRRIDEVEVTPVWREAERLTARHGLIAVAYERKNHEFSRVHQFALNYVVQASLDIYSCPLAMTDGAARTLLDMGNRTLIDRALPRLTSRDPKTFWTSGQWMTERTGGSDVGLSETEARRSGDTWRLYGTKWFTSAVTAQMALTLARPEGNGPGGRGLALFYLELRDERGALNGIEVNRLKDKLGTRKVPTAELTLNGTQATPVVGLTDGIRNISSMLNITRTWNAVAAAWGMRRGLALAKDYAKRRSQFGAPLAQKPLHVDTLAGVEAEAEAAFLLTFRTVGLLGRVEAGVASDAERSLFRLLTPITKLTTGKQGVAVASEVLEAFGGAGYVEDTGLPTLLRDSQVLSIWEGTTNVLSLDALKVLAKERVFDVYREEIEARLTAARDPALREPIETVRRAVVHATEWTTAMVSRPGMAESGARRFALTLGRALALALLVDHAQWCLDHDRGRRALAAARRFARQGIDLIDDIETEESQLLV